jgi:hypothetical protein
MPTTVSLLISVPAYNSCLHANCCLSIMALMGRLRDLGISHELKFVLNRSLVTEARNEIANTFLFDSKYTHLFQIDSDISFRADDVIKALASDRDFVGLPYPFKTLNWGVIEKQARAGVSAADLPKKACSPVLSLLPELKYDDKGLLEVKHVGSGLLLLKRHVFERLAAAHPEWKHELRESESAIYSERKGVRDFAFTFFAEGFDSDGYALTEDFKLCEDWRALGGTVHLAAWAASEHHGSFAYTWNGQ